MFEFKANFREWSSERYDSFPTKKKNIELQDVLDFEEKRSFLIQDVILIIFKRISLENLYVCSQVCKEWHLLTFDISLLKQIVYRDKVFSANDWSVYFSHDVEKSEVEKAFQSFPIDEFLEKSPLYNGGKSLGETHFFFWIPPNMTVHKFRLILKKQNWDIIGNSLERYKKCRFYWKKILGSGWAAMSRKSVLGTAHKTFLKQQNILNRFKLENGQFSTHPLVLEALICISTGFFKFKIESYEGSYNRVRCQEIFNGDDYINLNLIKNVSSASPFAIYITFDSDVKAYSVGAASVFRFNK